MQPQILFKFEEGSKNTIINGGTFNGDVYTSELRKKPAATAEASAATTDTPAAGKPQKAEEAKRFGFIIYRRHSQAEIEAQMESLSIKCQGTNSRALMRLLNDLDKEEYIDISDVTAAELYAELVRVFGLPQIKKRTFAEAFRHIG